MLKSGTNVFGKGSEMYWENELRLNGHAEPMEVVASGSDAKTFERP